VLLACSSPICSHHYLHYCLGCGISKNPSVILFGKDHTTVFASWDLAGGARRPSLQWVAPSAFAGLVSVVVVVGMPVVGVER